VPQQRWESPCCATFSSQKSGLRLQTLDLLAHVSHYSATIWRRHHTCKCLLTPCKQRYKKKTANDLQLPKQSKAGHLLLSPASRFSPFSNLEQRTTNNGSCALTQSKFLQMLHTCPHSKQAFFNPSTTIPSCCLAVT